MTLLTVTVRSLARLYPYDVEASAALGDSLAFVESPHDPETIVRAGYGAGAVGAIAPFGLFALPFAVPMAFVVAFALLTSVAAVHAVHAYPHLRAAFRRTEALGDAPNVIGRAVLRMQIQPSLESAVRFAAETGRGPLSTSLGNHVARARGTPRTGLLAFAEEWAEWFPALRRSGHLLATAQDAPASERGRTLDRSLSAVLDGTRDQMAAFTASIRAPTTALFAFGILLPLALVALVPVLPMGDFVVNIWMFVFIYNLVLPGALVAASCWLLVRRPVAFPPPRIGRHHPDLPNRLALRAAWGPLAGAGTYAVVAIYGPMHLAPVAAVGFGSGVALLAVFGPVLRVRHAVRDVESHLTDGLYVIGRQVAEGESVESAIELAAERVPAETGAAFERAAGVQRRLHTSVEAAFLGTYGALRDVPSQRAHATAALLAIAADEGKPAGRAIVSMADHLEELERVEAETKRNLAEVTGTLDNTAAYFGPLVAGATVAMAERLSDADLSELEGTAAAFPADDLSVVIGVYVLTLCFILTPLSFALRYGMDRTLCCYHAGRACCSAAVLYVLTAWGLGVII